MLPELAAPVQKGEEKKAVIWELRDNVLYPHLVTKGESNGKMCIRDRSYTEKSKQRRKSPLY